MANYAFEQQDDFAKTWGGKESPFKVSYGKMMMWFFLVSDALTFGGFLVAYGFSRHTYTGEWPIGEETFHALPFLTGNYPLMYVAFMTFLLIISSVTMVLAVEAGHRMDRKNVTKWMALTIAGGLIFVGSQAWEWSHFIHGSDFGKVELADGSKAVVHAEKFGELQNFTVQTAGYHYKAGQVITEKDMDLKHEYLHAIEAGHVKEGMITLKDGSVAKIAKSEDVNMTLVVKEAGKKYALRDRIEGAEATAAYYEAVNSGEKQRIVFGANMTRNEYGPKQYANYFFFITGFHGFHVSIGIIINIVVFINVLKGTYEKRGHYEMVEKSGLYWHFVDLVWVFVFTFFYLV
jgi:cytochrome c oxidase subunit III